MPALPSPPLAPRHPLARTLLVRLAGNAAGFALCYVLLEEILWALGERYVAPLVPRPPDAFFHHAGEDFNRAQDFVRTHTLAMCVPSLLFALAVLGLARWRHYLWYALGPLLGLLLGDIRDYTDTWNMNCGGASAPWHATLAAQGLVLAFAAWLPAGIATHKETPMHASIAHRTPRPLRPAHQPARRGATVALALLLALAAVLLAGCENSAGHHVGDTISNATVRITLTSVVVAPSDAKFQPAAGDEMVRVHVRYTNQGRSVLSFTEVQFTMLNDGGGGGCCGVPKQGTYFTFGKQGFPGYPLQPGATLESDMLFEVGKAAHDARLVYQPDGMDDIANFWWLLGL
jgi:hypothetical protein